MQAYDGSYILQHILKCGVEWPPPPVPLNAFLEKTSDEKLLELIKEGTRSQREEAFSAIYNRYHLDVWRFIKSKVSSDAEAKDIFSDVWFIALAKLPMFVWRDKPIKVWLITIANNKWLEFIRRVEQENSIALEDIHAQALDVIDAELQLDKVPSIEAPSPEVQTEADRLLLRAIAELKPIPRKIIQLIYFKNKNATEIGQILGMKPGTVRQTHNRALEKLRCLLSLEKVK